MAIQAVLSGRNAGTESRFAGFSERQTGLRKEREEEGKINAYKEGFFKIAGFENQATVLSSLKKKAEKGDQTAVAKYNAIVGDERAKQPVAEPSATPLNFGEKLATGVTAPFQRLGKGIGESLTLGRGEQQAATRSEQSLSSNLTKLISKYGRQLDDPNVPEAQKAHIRKSYDAVIKQQEELFSRSTARTSEILEATDPIKGAGAVLEVGSYALGGGGLRQVLSAGGKRALATAVAETAFGGFLGGAGAELEQKGAEATTGGVVTSGGIGAGVGVGLSVIGAGAGAAKRRIFNDGADIITDEARLLPEFAGEGAPVITDKSRLLSTGKTELQNVQERMASISGRLRELEGTGSEFKPGKTTLKNIGTERRPLTEGKTILEEPKGARTSETGQYGPTKPVEEFVIEPQGGTATVTKGKFQSVAKEVKSLQKERDLLNQRHNDLVYDNAVEQGVDPKLAKKLADVERKLYAAQVEGAPTTAADARSWMRERAQILREIKDPKIKQTKQAGQKVLSEVPKEPGRLKRAVISVKGQFSNMGAAGKEISKRLDDSEAIAETSVGRWTLESPSVFKLGKRDFNKFVDSLETLRNGGQIKAAPKIQKAIDEWTALAPKIRQEALDAGLDVGDLGPHYFPKSYPQLKGQKNLQKAAEHLVATGQSENLGEAIQALRIMQKAAKTRPYGHLEMERVLDLPDYDKSKKALAEYLGFSGQRLGNAKNFGADGSVANELLDQLGKEGFDLERATKNYRIAVGQETYGDVRTGVSKFARQFNAFRSLRNAAISNAGQTTNTATVSGVLNTIKGGLKLLSPSTRRFVTESGTTADAIINNITQQYGLEGLAGRLGAPIFGQVEKFNRSVATSAGEVWATKLAKKGGDKATRQLRKLGVTGEIGKELTDAQRIQAARGLVERTQFKVGAKDLPAWASSPEGRMISQFRTFTYKQSGFMYNEVLKPLQEGNIAPLVRFMSALPIGLGVSYGRNLVKTKLEQGKDFQEDMSWSERVIDAYESLGALGFGGSVKYSAEQAGKPGFGESVASNIGGPTVGYLAGTARDITEAGLGNADRLKRRGIEAVTGPAGKAISNRVVPYNDKTLSGNLDKDTGETLKALSKEVGYEPQLPDKKQRDKELSDEEYDKYVDIYKGFYSGYLNQVINTDSFKKASPETKKLVLQGVASRAGDDARNEMFGEEKKTKKTSEQTRILRNAGIR